MILYSREQDGTLNVCVTGYLTKDAHVAEKVVLFSVCYGKNKYMDAKVWRSDETLAGIASCLEKHDTVMAAGIYETFQNRNGETKNQIKVDFVYPLSVPAAAAVPVPDEQDQAAAGTWQDVTDDEGELPF